MIKTYDLGLVKQASFVSQFDPVSLSFAIIIAALLQRDEAITIVCTGASGASARSWRKGRRRVGGRATAGLRRFVDRKMIVARGLSPCKRASRSGSWICGIDGPSRRPAGRHAEFAGANRQRIDNLTRRSGATAPDLSPKSIGISIYLSHSLIPPC